MKHRRLILAVILVGVTASSLAAQTAENREGFFTAAGIGYGSATFTCAACTDTSRQAGFTGYFGVGAGLSEMFILLGEVDFWWKNTDAESLWINNIMGVLQIYPSEDTGFFVKGGLGYTHSEGFYVIGSAPQFRALDGFILVGPHFVAQEICEAVVSIDAGALANKRQGY